MVTSHSITGESFHTFTDPDQYPDLLNIHPKPPTSPAISHGAKLGQPLNPAALVVPPTPPAQFPHQFQHLIHHKQQPPRAHSPTQQSVLVSPLLSPPAQFSSSPVPSLKNDPKGYVTLPRKLNQSRGPIDWSSMSDRPPIYDGVGPRTSATGTKSEPKRSSSLKRFPDSKSRDSSGSEVTLGMYLRYSSLDLQFPIFAGGEESFTAYCEPFGKSLPPLTSNNHKNTCNATSLRPDSIASAVDADLEAIVSGDGPFSSTVSNHRKRSKCPMHKSGVGPKIISIPSDNSPHPVVQVSKGPKQLKGILKGPKSNITTNPMLSNGMNSKESSVTSGCSDSSPPPLTDAMQPTAVHISKAPKPPQRTSSSMNSKNVSEALHV